MNKTVKVIFALAAIMPASVVAQAPLTIEVPVEVENLHPSVTDVVVNCFVAPELPPPGEEILPTGQQADGVEMKGALVQVSRDGSAHSSARVEFDQDWITQAWLLSAREYRCRMALRTGQGAYWELEEGAPNTEEETIRYAQRGSLVAVVEGTLPGR